MNRSIFDKLKTKSSTFKYSALKYTEYKDIEDYDLQANDDNLILIYGYNREAKIHEYLWAANKVATLINALKYKKEYIFSFVPKEWVPALEKAGLKVRNAWHDYYLHDLTEKEFDICIDYDFLRLSEINIASQITTKCTGQSRGFTGQTPQWFNEWLNSNDIKNTAVLVSRTENHKISGLVCVGTYGHNSDSGHIAWIREVAVDPVFQGKGIGRSLVSQALKYGKEHRAKKAFLAVDEDNTNAILLYNSLGFKASSEDSEITMIKTI